MACVGDDYFSLLLRQDFSREEKHFFSLKEEGGWNCGKVTQCQKVTGNKDHPSRGKIARGKNAFLHHNQKSQHTEKAEKLVPISVY